METNSTEFDTIRLLPECDAGSKMAVSASDEVLDRTQGSTLKNLLLDAKQHHAKLGNDIHTELAHCHGNTKEPSPVAKGMAWAKTNMKLTLEQSDATVANLITDGCDMGINALQRCLNDYPDASHAAKDLCRRLMSVEDTLREDLRSYL